MKKWVEELKSNGPKDVVMAIVGNKIDRYDDEEVNYSEVKEYANQNKAILKLVSAKEGKNITVIMIDIEGFIYKCSSPSCGFDKQWRAKIETEPSQTKRKEK